MASAVDLFAAQDGIQAGLDALVAQLAPNELHTGAAITLTGTAPIHRLLPGVFFRPTVPESVEAVGLEVQERQIWEVACAVQTVPDKQGLTADYAALGELAAGVLGALNNRKTAVGALTYVGRDEPFEASGHVELVLRFAVDLVLGAVAETALADFARYYAEWDLGPEPDGQIDATDDLQVPTQ